MERLTSPARFSQPGALLLIGVLAGICLTVIVLAPVALAMALAAGVAAAWCAWLECSDTVRLLDVQPARGCRSPLGPEHRP